MFFSLLPKSLSHNIYIYIYVSNVCKLAEPILIQAKFVGLGIHTPVCRMENVSQFVPHFSHMDSHMLCAPHHHT